MLSLFDNKKIVCGVDEAGRGSLAGPVTAAAVILPKNYKNSFIKDSKKINHKKYGKYIIATNKSEIQNLEALFIQGKKNKVKLL